MHQGLSAVDLFVDVLRARAVLTAVAILEIGAFALYLPRWYRLPLLLPPKERVLAAFVGLFVLGGMFVSLLTLRNLTYRILGYEDGYSMAIMFLGGGIALAILIFAAIKKSQRLKLQSPP